MAAARDRTIALLITVLMVVSAGCSRGEGPSTPTAQIGTPTAEESTPEATEAQPTEPSEPADPYAIPADPNDMDEEYVEKVLEALMVSIAEAAKAVARQGQLTAEAERGLRATHREEPGSSIIRAFRDALKKDPSGRLFNPNASPTDITVKKILSADRDCVFVLVVQDTSGLVREDIKPFTAYYQLESKARGEDPRRLNPTPWMVVADAEPRTDGKEYANPCV